jgi:hypothetical protein
MRDNGGLFREEEEAPTVVKMNYKQATQEEEEIYSGSPIARLTVIFVMLELVFCDRLVVPWDGFFVGTCLLPHSSCLYQAIAREGEEKIQLSRLCRLGTRLQR